MSSLGIGTEARVYVGVMSGTSLDGISAAAVRFADKLGAAPVNDEPRATLLAFRVTPYTDEQHAQTRERRQHRLHQGRRRLDRRGGRIWRAAAYD